MQSDESCPCKEGRCVCASCAKSTTPKVLRKKGNQWHQEELPFYNPNPYKKSYEPHEMSSKEKFYSDVSKKKPKPDPATVEAELQQEEELWNQ